MADEGGELAMGSVNDCIDAIGRKAEKRVVDADGGCGGGGGGVRVGDADDVDVEVASGGDSGIVVAADRAAVLSA